jgi:hypothetical protein
MGLPQKRKRQGRVWSSGAAAFHAGVILRHLVLEIGARGRYVIR